MIQRNKKVSIILTAGQKSAVQISALAQRAAEANHWSADFLHVDPTLKAPLNTPTITQTCTTLREALRKSKQDTIIVLDENALIDSDQWRWAEKQLDHNPVQCIYWPGDAPARRLTKLLIWFFSMLSRLLFKHPVSALMPTALFIDNQPNTIETIVDSTMRLTHTNNSTWKIASAIRLDACIRTKFHPASPAIPLPHQLSADLNRSVKVNSSTVRAAFTNVVQFWFRDTMFPKLAGNYQSSRSMGTNAKLKRVVAWSVLLLVSAAVLGYQLTYPLFEPDETRNSQIALNIVENNQWMALELNQTHYWDKPPLMAWATALSYQTLGVNETTSRLPGVLMMMACVAIVLFAGKRIVGFRAAWIGAMLTLLSCGIPFTGRFLTMDSALTLFVTATLLSIYTGSFDGRFRKAWWIAAGICTGLGLLSKGPVMLVICLPPVILFSWMTGTPIFNKARRIAYWAIPCLLIAGPWYVGTMIATPEFMVHFFWKHNVTRFTTAFNHQQPFWFYVPVILVAMFPASQLLWMAIKFLGTRKPEVRALRSQAHGFLLIVPLWMFVFFSLSQAKLPTYIFPAIPTLCLLLGAILDVNIFQHPKLEEASLSFTPRSWFNFNRYALPTYYRRLPVRLALNMAFWITIISVAVLYVLPSAAASKTYMVWSAVLTVLATAVACLRRAHPAISWSANCVLALFLSSLISHRIIPAMSQTRSIQNSVAQMKQQSEFSDRQVVYFARDNFAPQLLLGDLPITHFPETETFKAAKFLQENPTALLVSTPDHIKELRKALDWNIRISKHETARHVYLTSPTQKPAAHIADGADSENSSTR